jgi:hypothetical protein
MYNETTYSSKYTTLEQYGQKKNIIFLERTQSMTLTCDSLAYLWIKAINIATNLSNRCPTRTNNGISPKNRYLDVLSQVDHLQNFGSLAYVLMPKN